MTWIRKKNSLLPLCLGALLAWALLVLPGCSAKYYKDSADRQVYNILRKKHEMLFGTAEVYEIEQMAREPMADLPRAERMPFTLPVEVRRGEEMPLIISLEKALDIATYNHRDYQSEKEDVYLTALSLTQENHKFSTQFNGILSAFYNKDFYKETMTANTGFSVSKMLRSGATVGIDISTEFLRHLTGDPRQTIASVLAVKIIQPLWRGAGRRVAQENLTQAERNVVYAVRSLARYRKTLSVDIASQYYRVLQQRNIVRNEESNYKNLQESRARSEMLAKAGRLPEFQVDQAKQNELSAKDRWVNAVQTYFDQLDRFKITLGLPTDANVELDEADLQSLIKAGIEHPALSSGKAVEIALGHRLDLMNSEERIVDAERKVVVAKNGLGADVSLVFESSTPTQPEARFEEFRFEKTRWNAGLDINLPLDRLAERNAYRAALISLASIERSYALKKDGVKLDVRQAWRTMEKTKESYTIQMSSVALAKRRVESTTLLLQAGRASTRDLLESRDALLEAQNSLIRALMNHTIARMEFYRDMGILRVDKKGLWHIEDIRSESTETEKPENGGKDD